MIRGIHYFSTELKTKIDVIPRGCFIIYNKSTVLSHHNLTLTCYNTYSSYLLMKSRLKSNIKHFNLLSNKATILNTVLQHSVEYFRPLLISRTRLYCHKVFLNRNILRFDKITLRKLNNHTFLCHKTRRLHRK